MSSSGGEERSKKWERRYREALDASAAAFVERGYVGASMKDIAEKLGILQGSLYYYLPSKEAALEAICEQGIKKFTENLESILKTPMPAREKLRAAVNNHVSPLRNPPEGDYVRVFLHHRHHLPQPARRSVSALARRYQNLAETLFEEGIRVGEFKKELDSKLAAQAMFALCNAVIGSRSISALGGLDNVIEAFSDVLLHGVGSITVTAPNEVWGHNASDQRRRSSGKYNK